MTRTNSKSTFAFKTKSKPFNAIQKQTHINRCHKTTCNRGVRGDENRTMTLRNVRSIILSSSKNIFTEYYIPLNRWSYLVHFINLWSRGISAVWWWCSSKVSHIGHTTHSTSRHTTQHTPSTLCSSIRSRDDWSPDIFNLFLLRFIFFSFRIGIGIDPINGLFDCILNLLLIILFNQVLEFSIIQCIPHLIGHILQIILCLNRLPLLFILCFVFLSICHNLINLLFTQTTLIGIDGNLLDIIRILLISSRDTQNTICIQIKGNLDLRHSTWSRR